jgi:hypothetical protein
MMTENSDTRAPNVMTRGEKANTGDDLGLESAMTGKGNGPDLQKCQIEIETKTATEVVQEIMEETEIARDMHGETMIAVEAETAIGGLKVCIMHLLGRRIRNTNKL